MVRNIMSVGVPNGVENSLFQLGKIVMLSLISTCGTASIAANAIGNNVAQYQILGGMSVGIAMDDGWSVSAWEREIMKKCVPTPQAGETELSVHPAHGGPYIGPSSADPAFIQRFA